MNWKFWNTKKKKVTVIIFDDGYFSHNSDEVELCVKDTRKLHKTKSTSANIFTKARDKNVLDKKRKNKQN